MVTPLLVTPGSTPRNLCYAVEAVAKRRVGMRLVPRAWNYHDLFGLSLTPRCSTAVNCRRPRVSASR
jgi:hypothetical protein